MPGSFLCTCGTARVAGRNGVFSVSRRRHPSAGTPPGKGEAPVGGGGGRPNRPARRRRPAAAGRVEGRARNRAGHRPCPADRRAKSRPGRPSEFEPPSLNREAVRSWTSEAGCVAGDDRAAGVSESARPGPLWAPRPPPARPEPAKCSGPVWLASVRQRMPAAAGRCNDRAPVLPVRVRPRSGANRVCAPADASHWHAGPLAGDTQA